MKRIAFAVALTASLLCAGIAGAKTVLCGLGPNGVCDDLVLYPQDTLEVQFPTPGAQPGAGGGPAVIAQEPQHGIIDLGPIIGQVAAPIVNAVIDALIVLVGGWLAWLYHRITGSRLDDKALQTIETAAENRAHALVAAGAVKVGENAKVDVGQEALADMANGLIAANKDSAARLGVDAAGIAAKIVAKLPQVPAVATAQAAALAPSAAAE